MYMNMTFWGHIIKSVAMRFWIPFIYKSQFIKSLP